MRGIRVRRHGEAPDLRDEGGGGAMTPPQNGAAPRRLTLKNVAYEREYIVGVGSAALRGGGRG